MILKNNTVPENPSSKIYSEIYWHEHNTAICQSVSIWAKLPNDHVYFTIIITMAQDMKIETRHTDNSKSNNW